jgi:ATP/maltotriose-dependent transcriptional regulator MalT
VDDLRSTRAGSASGDDRIAKLCRATQGWPAAIALGIAAGISIDLDVVPAPADRSACYRYFAEALIAALPRRDREFIDATCLFATFNASLLECAGIFEVSDTLARLADDAGVITVNSGGTYAYDMLFAEFVVARLRARGEDRFKRAATAAAAADAYLREGCHSEAIALYVKLSDFAAVGNLLSEHGFDLMDHGESSTVARALQALPEEVLTAFPGALAVKACYESLHGKFDVAEAWFRLALSRLTDDTQRNVILYRFGIDLVRSDRLDVIELLEPAVCGIAPEAPLAAQLLALLAAAYALGGQLSPASLMIERALLLLPRLTDRDSWARVLHQASFVALQCTMSRARKHSLRWPTPRRARHTASTWRRAS